MLSTTHTLHASTGIIAIIRSVCHCLGHCVAVCSGAQSITHLCWHKTLFRVSADKQTKAFQLDNTIMHLQLTVRVKGV